LPFLTLATVATLWLMWKRRARPAAAPVREISS